MNEISNAVAGIGAAFIIGIFAFYGLLFIYAIVAYVLQSISLQTIAKRRGIAKPWLAWIPVANNWIFGAIARDYDKQNGINRRWDKILLILSIVVIALCFALEIIVLAFVFMLVSGSSASPELAARSVLYIIMMYLPIIPIFVLTSILNLLKIVCLYKLFESTVPNKALTYFLLFYFVPFAAPFCLFACRNKGYEIAKELPVFEPVNVE